MRSLVESDIECSQVWSDEIAAAAASTPWLTGGCRNWYVDDRSGRLTLLWPGTVQAFRERLAGTDGSEFEPVHTPVIESTPTHPHA